MPEVLPSKNAAEALKRRVEEKYKVSLKSEDGTPWTSKEVSKLDSTLAKVPEQLVRGNPGIKAFARSHFQKNAPAGAPGDAKRSGCKITLYDQGVKNRDGSLSKQQYPESILHELAHTFEKRYPKLWKSWIDASGWKTDGKKWSYTKDTGFIYDYAKKSPQEDLAIAFSRSILTPLTFNRVSPIKHKIIQGFLKELNPDAA